MNHYCFAISICLCIFVKLAHGDRASLSTDQENGSNSDFMKHVIHGCINPRHLALTFDDGIGPYTGKLLDVLKSHRIRGNFFILGNTLSPEILYAEHHKYLLVRMIREGHLVGSHSFDHPDLTGLSTEELRRQMRKTDQAIQSVVGVRPRFVRPPYGYVNRRVVGVLKRDGYILINWNKDTNDWRHQDNHRAILTFVKDSIPKASKSREGPIVLQHDTLKSSLLLASKIIQIIRDKGYEFVTIDECIGQLPYRM